MRLVQTKTPNYISKIIFFSIMLILIIVSILYSTNLKNSIENIKGTLFSIDGTVTAASFSSDGTTIYLGMRDNRIIAMTHEGQPLWEHQTQGSVLDIKSNGDYVYVSDDGRKIHVLDSSGKAVGVVNVPYRPITIAGSKNGERILVGSSLSAMKNRLQLYDSKGELIYSKDPNTIITDVYLLEDDKSSIYIARNAMVVLLDENGQEKFNNKIDFYPVDSSYSSDLKMLIVLDEGNNIYAFDEKLKRLWKIKMDIKINTLDIDPQNQQVIAVSNEGEFIVFDLSGNEKYRLKTEKEISKLIIDHFNSTILAIKGDKILKYDGTVLNNYAKYQLMLRMINSVKVVLYILFAISIINLIPRLSYIIIKYSKIALKVFMRHKLSYFLILPTIILLLIFNYYPAISGLIFAFTDYKPGIYMRWVGLDNFKAMIEDPYFWTGIKNMIIFLFTDLIKAIIPPILFAELIFAMRSKKAQYWTRVALYLPGILPGIAGLLVWTSGIYGQNGLINSFLRAINLAHLARPWLGLEQTAIWALVFIGFPFVGSYIIFYGALIAIPDSLIDAAKIDGCGWIKRILTIDVPMISPQIKYVFVTTFIASVQNFQLVYVTTMGGPGHATYTPMLELFYNMSKFQRYGVASAMGLFLFLVIFGFTILNLRIRTAYEKM